MTPHENYLTAERPSVVDGKCKKGYKKCASEFETGGFCRPLSFPDACPITDIQIMSKEELNSRKLENWGKNKWVTSQTTPLPSDMVLVVLKDGSGNKIVPISGLRYDTQPCERDWAINLQNDTFYG
jgi:hypothetical protein